MSFLGLMFHLLLVNSLLLGQAGTPRIWAVSDNVRVDPQNGTTLIQGKREIHPDYPSQDFRGGNSVWDAVRKKVLLSSARNEFVAFQTVVEVDGPIANLDVTLPFLEHSSGQRLDGNSVRIFKVWYVQVRRPSTGYEATSLGPAWYADALMPKRESFLFTGFPFSIPDLYNNIPDQRNHSLWIDIYVPFTRDEAPPGKYSGKLIVSWEGGKTGMGVELDVWDFALPQENHLRGDFWNNSMRQMPVAEELAYYQMAKRHRFLPLVYAYRPGFSAERGEVKIDWSEYDRRLQPYVDGTAFTDKYDYWGPGYGVPVTHMMLPFNISTEKHPGGAWPIPLPEKGRTPEYEAAWKETARQFREHIDSIPAWKSVEKIVFLNGLDESYFEGAYEEMLYYGKLLHEALGRGWFFYRIDGGYDREVMEQLAREVDLWVCHTVAFDPATARHFENRGLRTWFYGPMIYEQRKNSGCGSNTFLDLDLNVNRAIGWIGWKYQTGWVEWEFDWNARAAWYEAENFKEPERIFNGSGQLIYRGDVMNYDGPVPSIRLKSTRRGLQDYEYFWLLTETTGNPEAANRIVNRVIYKNPFGEAAMLDTGIWKNDPAEWEKARIEAGELIAEAIQ
jgi:hypothetical protein